MRQRRNEKDPKTLGHLFFLRCEDVKDLDILTALQQLLELFETLSEDNASLNMNPFKNQLAGPT